MLTAMKPTKEVTDFLDEYLSTLTDKEQAEFSRAGYDVWALDDESSVIEPLVNAIVKGRKKNTASIFRKSSKIPAVGSYGMVLDSSGIPKCLVRYLSFSVRPFSRVTTEFIQEDGNSDDLDEWKIEHRRRFKNQDSSFTDETPILFGRFKLAFRIP